MKVSVENLEDLRFTPFTLFESVPKNSPPATRLQQLRGIAKKFREKLLETGTVTYYKSFDLIRVPYPVKFGFDNIVSTHAPFLHILNRMYVVQFLQNGTTKTLLFSPSDLDANAETPFFHRIGKSFGIFEEIGKMIVAPVVRTVEEALKLTGISPKSVDYISYDHLHTQDLRRWLGNGYDKGYFPNAKLLIMEEEYMAIEGLLPTQKDWYCPYGLKNVPRDRIELFSSSIFLGGGVALLKTPGHTMGNHSLVVNTPKGVLVTSENGISADSYNPQKSKIKEIRDYAKATGVEVILNGNTRESSVEQYISMVIEKEVAGEYIDNHEFYGVSPSSEFSYYWAFPELRPTFEFGEMQMGVPVY